MSDRRDDDRTTATDELREWLVISASGAVAARDAAIERGDNYAAAEFTNQARDAIAAAQRAGISREQLAAALDYPGGAAALDPATADRADQDTQIGYQRGDPPPSTAELAARIAALRAGAVADDDPGRADQLARWHRDDANIAEAGLSTGQGAVANEGSGADVSR